MGSTPRILGRPESATGLPSAAYAAILAAVIVAALSYGQPLLIPLALAILLSFILSPLVVGLRKLRVPRAPAIGLVVSLMIAIVGVLGMAMARQVTELVDELPRYETTLREKLKTLRTGVAQTSVVDRATSTLNGLSREFEQSRPPGDQAQPGQLAPAANPPAAPIPVVISSPERPFDSYQRILTVLLAPLTMTGIVLVLIIFILMQREDMRDRVIRLVGAGDIEMTTAALNDAAFRLSRLFLVQTAINATFGVVITVGLWAIGVPSPLLWGITAALMRFIPYIGAIFAAVFPVLLAAAVDPGWSMVMWTLALYVVAETAVGQFIEPWIQGHTTGLSPLAIVVSAILWTALWGPIGLLLATPLTTCLVVLGRHVEGLGFLDVILGDQPALSPPEIFYQRMLSGASAEAADQAQSILKTTSLVDYFDSVARPGLLLASQDAHRGALDVGRISDLHEEIMVLLDDVAEEPLLPPEAKPAKGDDDPATAPPATAGNNERMKEGDRALVPQAVLQPDDLSPDWRSQEPPPVLCLGAHTLLDASAAEILAHLLRRHGIGVRMANLKRLADLRGLDLEGTKLVWISSVDSAQSHARIRYLARRLRRSSPDVIFCGGLWDGPGNESLKEGAGLAHQATNFASAVAITCDLATGATGGATGRSDDKSKKAGSPAPRAIAMTLSTTNSASPRRDPAQDRPRTPMEP